MRNWVLRVGLLLLLPLAVRAQELPKAEIYAGYSFVRDFTVNHHGWDSSIAATINPNLALVADFSGHYAKVNDTTFGFPFEDQISVHSVMIGPRVSDSVGKWRPFGQVLLGASRVSESTELLVGTTTLSDSFNRVGFWVTAGGGMDYWITRRVAIRIVQAEYYMFKVGDTKNETPRLGFGLLFAWGSKPQ